MAGPFGLSHGHWPVVGVSNPNPSRVTLHFLNFFLQMSLSKPSLSVDTSPEYISLDDVVLPSPPRIKRRKGLYHQCILETPEHLMGTSRTESKSEGVPLEGYQGLGTAGSPYIIPTRPSRQSSSVVDDYVPVDLPGEDHHSKYFPSNSQRCFKCFNKCHQCKCNEPCWTNPLSYVPDLPPLTEDDYLAANIMKELSKSGGPTLELNTLTCKVCENSDFNWMNLEAYEDMTKNGYVCPLCMHRPTSPPSTEWMLAQTRDMFGEPAESEPDNEDEERGIPSMEFE